MKMKKFISLFLLLVFFCTNVDARQLEEGEIYGRKDATVVGNDPASRNVDIKLSIEGKSYEEIISQESEIVFVLDTSGSMDEKIIDEKGGTRKIDTLKTVTSELMGDILSKNKNIKIGIVYFGKTTKNSCSLSNDSKVLRDCIAGMDANGGTNIQAGLSSAKKLFTQNDNTKTIVLLTDGIPTFYSDGIAVHGTGSSDNYEHTNHYDHINETTLVYYADSTKTNIVRTCNYNFDKRKYTCVTEDEYKPSTRALKEIEGFNGELYSVGFGVATGSDAEKFLLDFVGEPNHYYSAENSNTLSESFNDIIENISLIGTNVSLIDVVPNTFIIDEDYLIDKFKTKEVTSEGTVFGNKVIVSENGDGSHNVKWIIGDLLAGKSDDLTFRVRAKDNYFGNMYTNNWAKIYANVDSNNPFFEGQGNPVEIPIPNQEVIMPAITRDNSYTVDQGDKLIVDLANSILINDSQIEMSDNNANVSSRIVVVDSDIIVNNDGTFEYQTTDTSSGNITYDYYIETTVVKNGETTVVRSNTSTVTITINEKIMGTVTVKYIDKDTDEEIANRETLKGKVTEDYSSEKKDLVRYNFVDVVGNPTGKFTTENGEIVYRYEKIMGTVTVKFVDIEGNSISEDQIITGQIQNTYTTNAKSIENYTLITVEGNENGLITEEGYIVTYIYDLESQTGTGSDGDDTEEPGILTGLNEINLSSYSLIISSIVLIITNVILNKRKKLN